MKKQLVVLAALVAVLFCLSVAIVKSNDRQANYQAAQTSQVKQLQDKVVQAQAVQALHDQANQANLKNSADQILKLQADLKTVCTQVKTAKLVQPLCQ